MQGTRGWCTAPSPASGLPGRIGTCPATWHWPTPWSGAFGRLMKVLGLDDRIPPSKTGMDIGVPLTPEQQGLLFTELPRVFRARPRDYWVKALLEADVCGIEHLRPGEVFDTEQARHN